MLEELKTRSVLILLGRRRNPKNGTTARSCRVIHNNKINATGVSIFH